MEGQGTVKRKEACGEGGGGKRSKRSEALAPDLAAAQRRIEELEKELVEIKDTASVRWDIIMEQRGAISALIVRVGHDAAAARHQIREKCGAIYVDRRFNPNSLVYAGGPLRGGGASPTHIHGGYVISARAHAAHTHRAGWLAKKSQTPRKTCVCIPTTAPLSTQTQVAHGTQRDLLGGGANQGIVFRIPSPSFYQLNPLRS
jgi:hypothetical protein